MKDDLDLKPEHVPAYALPHVKSGPLSVKEFGAWLKALREEKGLTLSVLGELTGYSTSHLSQVETGKKKNMPSPEFLEKLAEPLGVNYSDLLHMAGYEDLAKGVRLREATKDFQSLDNEEEITRRIMNIVNEVKKRAHLYNDGVAFENLLRACSLTINTEGIGSFETLKDKINSLSLETKHSLYAELIPWSSKFLRPELIYLLKSDDVTYNGHQLTDQDKRRILDMLKALFPEYAPKE